MLVPLLAIILALVSVGLVFIILIQNPKGGGMSSAFGGAQSATQILGAANTTDILERITWGLAASLLVLCLFVGVLFKSKPVTNTGIAPDINSVQQPMTPNMNPNPNTAPVPQNAPAPQGTPATSPTN
jgi:preprotein translocase subunit SecG